jgi:hypothetical protein
MLYILLCQLFTTGRWFSPGTFVSSTNKAEVALNTCNPVQSLHNSSSVRVIYVPFGYVCT